MRQDFNSGFDLTWRRVFIRTMADTGPAGNEDHCRRTDLGHEERVVVRPADHFLHPQAQLISDLCHDIDQLWAAQCRSIDVQPLDLKMHSSPPANLSDGALDLL